MTGWRRAQLAAALPLLLAAAPPTAPSATNPAARTAGAALPVVTIGDHAKFGRVTITLPRGVRDSEQRLGDQFIVTLPGAGAVPGLAQGPRNVGAIQGGQDRLALTLLPGGVPRVWHGAHRVVIDIYTPAGGAKPQRPATAPPPPSPQAPLDIALVPVTPPAKPPPQAAGSAAGFTADSAAAAVPGQALSAPATAAPDSADSVVAGALVAQLLPPDPQTRRAGMLVPFGREVGAAAFVRGGQAQIVFDDSKPVDLAAIRDDAVLGGARVTLLPAATMITLKFPPPHTPPGTHLALHRLPEGWEVDVTAPATPQTGAAFSMQAGVLAIATHAAGDTVVLTEPATGGKLLVGTTLGDDPGVSVPHFSAEFALLPSFAGVLVAAQSDRLQLRAGKTGFTLATNTGPKLAAVAGGVAERALGAAADLTRHFDFLPLPAPVLLKTLRAAVNTSAAAPRLARTAPRLRAAQTMLSLGMAREAAGVISAALRDDPAAAGSPNARALLAMAHFLSGVPGDDAAQAEDAQAIANPALGQSDEISLLRAIMPSPQANPAQAAASLAATWRLLLAYPEQLRHRLAPAVARGLMQGGQTAAAQALVDQLPDPALDSVRAALLARAGHVAPALAMLDRMAAGRDRHLAATAFRDAVEMRLAAHQTTPARAAEALDRHLYMWRDEDTEIAQRLRVAALRADAGAWRAALAGLRATDQLFPAAHDRVHAAELAIVGGLLKAGQAERLPALDLVALVEESADLLGSAEASSTLAPVLVDKLVALDLPQRAAPILAKLMAATAAPAPHAGLGARLAALRLDQGDAKAALAALDQSDANDLPALLQNDRNLVRARAQSALGHDDDALKLLDSVPTPEAAEMKTGLLEKRRDWSGAETVLHAMLGASLPPQGPLTDVQQDQVLRLASDAARAGDMAVLQGLQVTDGARLTTGNRSALLQALVQRPIQAVADLPRSAREAEASRAIPAALASYQGH